MDLQTKIELFTATYGPKGDDSYERFVRKLREIMNAYARAAIAHGDIPEKGVAHRE